MRHGVLPVLGALWLCLLASAVPAASQPRLGPSLGAEREVGGFLMLRSGATRAAEGTLPLVGVGAGLRLSPSVEFGGEALFGVRPLRVSPKDSPDRAELSLGYGGAQLRVTSSGGLLVDRVSAGVLLAAGTARVRSSLIGEEVGTDNFAILEPSLGLRWRLYPALAIGVEGGYRLTLGSDALPWIEAGSLQGPTMTFSLLLVRDP